MAQFSACEEYRALVDKAYSKFSRLRDFPPYGQNKWDFYFHKAFQVYSRLWKFQQDNRQKLVDAGLKRWEIGEIASRIGQLYYIYYLRTSDASFLKESFIFYEAILSREYFKEPGKDVSLANKQLRYFARFIVICLLLNRWEMVHRLVRQLHTLVEEYACSFQNVHPAETKEWKNVAQEVVRFLKVTSFREVGRPLRYIPLLDGQPSSFMKVEGTRPLKLQDAILVSYYHGEVKFSELSVDNFRMLQCLEWEPSGSYYRLKPTDSSSLAQDIVDPSLPPNPHKYILYRPTIQQLLLVLATVCEELSPDSIILLYISASSASGRQRSSVATSRLTSALTHGSSTELSSENNESSPDHNLHIESPKRTTKGTSECLWLGRRNSFIYPADLIPFTRKPFFVIVDSESSSIFESLSGEERGESVSLILSPNSCPSSASQNGSSLFTFFLCGPLRAFCQMTRLPLAELGPGKIEQAEKLLSSLLVDWGNLLASNGNTHPVWLRVLCDPFLRQFLLRFIFARACYTLHDLYMGKSDYVPRCIPPLPDEVSPRSKLVESQVIQIAEVLEVTNFFTALSPVMDERKQY